MTTTALISNASYLLQVRSFVDRLLIEAAPKGPLAVPEINSELIVGGFRCASKNFRVQVHNSCNAMAENGQLLEEGRGGRKFFKHPATTIGVLAMPPPDRNRV